MLNVNEYYLCVENVTIMDQIENSILNTKAKLRVIFNSIFQITHFELTTFSHNEISISKQLEQEYSSGLINEYGMTPYISRVLIVRFNIYSKLCECVSNSNSLLKSYVNS